MSSYNNYKYYNHNNFNNSKRDNIITPDPSAPNPNPIQRNNSKLTRTNSIHKDNNQTNYAMNRGDSTHSNPNNSVFDDNKNYQKIVLDKSKAIHNNNSNKNNNENVQLGNNRPDFISADEYKELMKRDMELKEHPMNKTGENQKKNNYNSFQNTNINNSLYPQSSRTNNNKNDIKNNSKNYNNSKTSTFAADSDLFKNIGTRNSNEEYDFFDSGPNNEAKKHYLNNNYNYQHMRFSNHSLYPQGLNNINNKSIPVNINKESNRNQTLNEDNKSGNNLNRFGENNLANNDYNIKDRSFTNINDQNANLAKNPKYRSDSVNEKRGASHNSKAISRSSSANKKELTNNNNNYPYHYNQVYPSQEVSNDIEIVNGSIRNLNNFNSSDLYNKDSTFKYNNLNQGKNPNSNLSNNLNINNKQNEKTISHTSAFTGNSIPEREAYLSILKDKNQNKEQSMNFNKQRDEITDLDSDIDNINKQSVLGFFKGDEAEYNYNNKNHEYVQEAENYKDQEFENMINHYGGQTKSIYIYQSQNPNSSEYINNIPYSESIQLENNSRQSGNLNDPQNKNSLLASSKYFNNTRDEGNFDINNINEIKKSNNSNINNNGNNYNTVYEGIRGDNDNKSNYNPVNSDCLNNIELILKNNNSSNGEIKNEKIFSSYAISKSFSKNLDDFVQVKETPINQKSLSSFFELLAKKYEAQFEYFFESLKKCDFSNREKQLNKIGPISSLEHYIQFKFSDFLRANEPILAIDLLENNIFRWRNICGDGNCFYRAVMFSYLENILIHSNDFEFLNFIKEIYDFVQKEAIKMIFEKNNIDYDFLIRALFFILYLKVSNKNSCNYPYSKYEMLIILINNCRDIDLGLVLYLRIKIFEFIENNKNKIYSQEFNVKMGNLLNEKYQADDDNFSWELFYEENLLKLYTEAENIIIYVTPLILQINLKIFTYDIGNNHSDKFRFIGCGLPGERHTAFVFYRKIHYDLIYSKEHFESIQNNFSNYFDTSLPLVNVEKLKVQAQQGLKMLKEKEIKKGSNDYVHNNVKREDFKNEMEIEDPYNINNPVNKNDNNHPSKIIKNKTIVENPNLIDFSDSKKKNINEMNNNNSKVTYPSFEDKNYSLNNKSVIGRNEKLEKGGNLNLQQSSLYEDNSNDKQNRDMNMDIDDNNFKLLNSIDIEENVNPNKNKVFNREINKSLMQKNKSLILNADSSSNQRSIPIKNDSSVLPHESNLRRNNTDQPDESRDSEPNPKANKSIYSDLIPNKNASRKLGNNESIHAANNKYYDEKESINKETFINKNESINEKENSAHKQNARMEKLNEQIIPCSICQEEIDKKISNFIEKALCTNCFLKELKSILSIKITSKIENSLSALLQEKTFLKSFDQIFKQDEEEQLGIFNNISEIKQYKLFLNIDFENLIKQILMENCLLCFLEDEKTCQPKSFMVLPCNCSFHSLNHFQIFIKYLIKINKRDKNLNNFTCLCNTKYTVTEILKIFEVINENKLDEEFYALKNYLMDYYFERFCCLCSKILLKTNRRNKIEYNLKDNMIGMFLHVTDFKHFACDECEIIIRNEKKRQKEQNRPLVFPCNICGFEHLFLN